MKIIRTISIFILAIALPEVGLTTNLADYLIIQDIGQYKYMGKGGGLGSGIISATGHFSLDHTDESNGSMYSFGAITAIPWGFNPNSIVTASRPSPLIEGEIINVLSKFCQSLRISSMLLPSGFMVQIW